MTTTTTKAPLGEGLSDLEVLTGARKIIERDCGLVQGQYVAGTDQHCLIGAALDTAGFSSSNWSFSRPSYTDLMNRTAALLYPHLDTELISAPAYMRAARDAPRINSYISVTGIAQDELGHAHIAYRLLRDLGVDVEQLVYERDPKDFRHPYAFDVPLDRWAEMVVANAFYDRAGFCILDDVFQNSSYGPWKRALVKVEREENFHLRHGEQWVATMSEAPESKKDLQAAIDWMFPMTLEWFGLPDTMKRHKEQIEYGMKGSTNAHSASVRSLG